MNTLFLHHIGIFSDFFVIITAIDNKSKHQSAPYLFMWVRLQVIYMMTVVGSLKRFFRKFAKF